MKKKNKDNRLWSDEITRNSDALTLDDGVFTWDDPRKIARSLKRSADESNRRKGTPFQSAMSMLNFYINRAGTNLPRERVKILNLAKDELRKLYGREPKSGGNFSESIEVSHRVSSGRNTIGYRNLGSYLCSM